VPNIFGTRCLLLLKQGIVTFTKSGTKSIPPEYDIVQQMRVRETEGSKTIGKKYVTEHVCTINYIDTVIIRLGLYH
jgi:hypothetical protein